VNLKVLTAVTVKIIIFRDVTPCSLEELLFYPEAGGNRLLRNIGNNTRLNSQIESNLISGKHLYEKF
jgi:hypothetical protein